MPVTNVARKPKAVDHVRAAALPLAAMTAWQGLFAGALELAPGKAADSRRSWRRLGSFAVQLAKWKGARVVAAGRRAQQPRSAWVRMRSWTLRRNRASAAGPVDAVLDLVGGELQQRAWVALRSGGVFASTMGEPSKDEAAKRDVRTRAVYTRTNAEQLAQIAELVERGVLQVEAQTLPLSEARRAHELLEGHGTVGKVVLTVG